MVIPGHGPVCDKATLQRQLDYYHWLIGETAAAIAAGETDEQILAEIVPPDDLRHWWRFVEWKHADSVEKDLRAVRHGDLSA